MFMWRFGILLCLACGLNQSFGVRLQESNNIIPGQNRVSIDGKESKKQDHLNSGSENVSAYDNASQSKDMPKSTDISASQAETRGDQNFRGNSHGPDSSTLNYQQPSSGHDADKSDEVGHNGNQTSDINIADPNTSGDKTSKLTSNQDETRQLADVQKDLKEIKDALINSKSPDKKAKEKEQKVVPPTLKDEGSLEIVNKTRAELARALGDDINEKLSDERIYAALPELICKIEFGQGVIKELSKPISDGDGKPKSIEHCDTAMGDALDSARKMEDVLRNLAVLLRVTFNKFINARGEDILGKIGAIPQGQGINKNQMMQGLLKIDSQTDSGATVLRDLYTRIDKTLADSKNLLTANLCCLCVLDSIYAQLKASNANLEGKIKEFKSLIEDSGNARNKAAESIKTISDSESTPPVLKNYLLADKNVMEKCSGEIDRSARKCSDILSMLSKISTSALDALAPLHEFFETKFVKNSLQSSAKDIRE